MERVNVIKALIAELESSDPREAEKYLSDDFCLMGASPEPLDKESFITLAVALKQGFPDWSYNLGVYKEDRGDAVRTVMCNSGTHTGIFALPGLGSVPPTGYSVAQPAEAIEFVFRANQICEIRVETASGGGLMGLLDLLGVELPRCTHGLFKLKAELEYA